MVRCRLGGGDILMPGEEVDLFRRRDVQDVDPRPRLAGDCDEALRALQGRDSVAPDRMGEAGSPATRSPSRSRRRNSSSEWKAAAPANVLQDGQDAGVVLDQRSPVDDPMNTLIAGRPRQALEVAEIVGIVARAADPEGKVAMHAVRRAIDLSASLSALVVSGLVFGISKTDVTPPRTAASDPVSRSSLCSRPGSRNWTWLSMTPGRTWSPVQSIRSAAEARDRSPIAAMRPSTTPMSRSPMPSWLTTVPPPRIRS